MSYSLCPVLTRVTTCPRTHVAFAAAAFAAAACSGATAPQPSSELPAGTPYLRGPVATLAGVGGTSPARVLVTSPGGVEKPCGLWASVSTRTSILRQTAAGVVRGASLDAIRVGDTVEVYVNGPVALSCPAHGDASAIVLVGAIGR